MKRNVMMFSALAATALVLASALPSTQHDAASRAVADDPGVVVRRMYEGSRPDMWGRDVSPDGRYATQTAWETGDLVVLDLLTGKRRRVTAKPKGWETDAYAAQSQFSPDGKAIAYVWYGDGDYEIRVIDIDGSNERVVVPGNPAVADWPDLHDWSPDGTQLLVTNYVEDVATMLLIDVASGTTKTLTEFPKLSGPGGAGFSATGRYVAFDLDTKRSAANQPAVGDADVYLIPVGGDRQIQLLGGPTNDRFLGWSPTGEEILFHSDRDLTEGVWRLTTRDGRAVGEPVLVQGDLWRMQRIGVSNGRLFYGIHTQRRELYTAGIDLTRGRLINPLPVREGTRNELVGPSAWSADGLMLAYMRAGRASDPHKVIIRSVDGEQAREIPSVISRAYLWWGSNQDQLIAYGRAGDDRDWRGLLQIDLRTGNTTRYLESEGVVRWAELTRDQKTAYYAEWDRAGSHFLKRHDLETGTVEHIARLDTMLTGLMIMRFTDLSPDERSLAFQSFNRRTKEWTVGTISLKTGQARALAVHDRQVSDPDDPNDPDVHCRMIVWTVDGERIVYARAVTGQRHCTIYSVPVAGGAAEAIGRMPSHTYASLTHDQSRIAFLHGEVRGEIWMMDEIPWGGDSS
jgi:hypothetical protein